MSMAPNQDEKEDGDEKCNNAENPVPSVLLKGDADHDKDVTTSTPKIYRRRKNSVKLDRCVDRFTMADVTMDTDTSILSRKKGKGKRRQNRLENVKYLLSLWDKDLDETDVEFGNESSPSVFTKIVTEDRTRKIWDEFAALSGEEQDAYLKFIEESKQRMINEDTEEDQCMNDNPAYREDGLLPGTDMFHATKCYTRIENKLKKTLCAPYLPLDLLRSLEGEVTEFFEKFPTSYYSKLLSNSFERLLLHALCQYLGLNSNSITKAGGRWTNVGKKKKFSPPVIPLSDFIEKHR